jgi:hypothetical protein
MNIDNKYIVDGIDIQKTKEGYRVFTIPTQHFDITNLDELTNERIEEEIRREEKYRKDAFRMIKLYFEEHNEN